MFKTFQKLQSKIPDPQKGIGGVLVTIGTGLLTVVGTALGVAVGGLAAKGITYGILVIAVVGFANTLYFAFITIGLNMLAWGISGPFSNMSMTNPANNLIISIGWTLLRDLTNMFFILGLAYIGLATALNFASFNTKKTFTTLILIALLINFTPVICGLIIDGTNIIMNFFLSEVDFSSIGDSWISKIKPIMTITSEKDAVDNMFIFGPKHTLVGIYSIMAGGVLTIFGFLLLMRHFIIWLLVILSPLAFFCRIFDFSKQWFTKWWSYFVSWSFIGIPAAFFLYLANHLMILSKARQLVPENNANTLGTELTPYLVTVVFMTIGLLTTLKIRAAGSGFIMNSANSIANKAKAVPGQIRDKIGKPMGENIKGNIKAGVMGLGFSKAARERGVVRQRKQEQRMAGYKERLGIKPRELEDISEEDLKKVASTPATTQEGMLRRAKAIKKLVDDDNFDTSNADQTKEMLAVMQQYPGMNIDKLKKAHPELEHLVDDKGYQKEIQRLIRLGIPPANAAIGARFNLMQNRTKRMGATEIANIPIEDYASTSNEMVAIFAGLTPGKIKKIGEEAKPERTALLKKFTQDGITPIPGAPAGTPIPPVSPEYLALMAKIIPGHPDRQTIDKVLSTIRGDVNFV